MKSCLLPVIAWLAVLAVSNTALAQLGTVAFSQSLYTADINQSNATITINFTGSTNGIATVDFMTSDGTATNGVDYVGISTTVQFPPSAVAQSTNIIISILNSGFAQATQTVNLALSSPTLPAILGTQRTAVLQIINIGMQQVEFDQSTYTTDDTDTEAIVTLVRTGGTNGTITVDFNTSDGTAQAGVDYTATSETVTFPDGVTTNTVAIPLLPPTSSGCASNQTVNLALSSPTGGAAIGSPGQAVLTIQTTAPPAIQFSAANYNVLEHAGRATVTAIRCGDTSGQVTVDYATSDGTAQNGVDYFGASGTLIFPPGVSSGGFYFQIVGFPTFQSNKTVNVTLSNPVGAALGSQDTAVVRIVNDRPQTIVFTNSDGVVVTLKLRSIGTMQVTNQAPLDLILAGTEASTKITMTVKSSKTNAPPQIDQIISDGDCGPIDARDFDVIGPGVQVAGYLKQLRIHDLSGDSSVTSGGAENQSTSIVAHDLEDGCTIDIGNRISSLQVAAFGFGTITAPRIGAFSIKGDKKNGILGDCEGTILISGDDLSTNQLALGSLVVAGAINDATIEIDNGSAGPVTASQMIDSTIFVGYTPNDPSNPISTGGTFVDGVRLSSVNIRSSDIGMVDSDIAAALMGGVHLANVDTDNGGIPFGITVHQVSGVSSKEPPFRFDPNGFSDQSLGDFHVLIQ